MKKVIFGLMMIITAGLFTGCSSVYRSGQTPDDLYYAEGSSVTNNPYVNNQERDQYQEEVSTQDDNYLRMKVANRNRWGSIDNFSYWNDIRYNYCYAPVGFSNYNGSIYFDPMISWYSNRFYNNYYSGYGSLYGNFGGLYGGFYGGYGNYYGNQIGWHNPIYTVINYSKPRNNNNTYTAGSNLSAYRNRTYNNSNINTNSNNNNNNNFSNLSRRVTPPPSTQAGSNNNSYDRPARTFSSSSSNSSSSTTTSSSSTGGVSGGFKSTGSSTNKGRGSRN